MEQLHETLREAVQAARLPEAMSGVPLQVEQLEDRCVPSVSLTVGDNVNISREPDNQAEGTIAIDPTNPLNVFAAAIPFKAAEEGKALGLFAAYSATGGGPGGWTDMVIGTGGPGGDSLPTALSDPRATFDQFGNLFLTYVADPILQFGTSSGGNMNNTFNDSSRAWEDREWGGMTLKITAGR